MKSRLSVLAVSLLGVSVLPAAALDPSTPIAHYMRASWKAQDGLPSSLTSAITQDLDGYIWLGTDTGLIRFDGVRFVPWEMLGRPSLPNRPIRALLTSRSGDLWIGFDEIGGLVRLHDGQVIKYSAGEGVPRAVLALFEDHAGIIWAGGLAGLSQLRDGRWEQPGRTVGLPDESVISIYEDTEENLWVGTVAGLFCRKAGETIFRRLPGLASIRAFGEDAEGAMWFVGLELGMRKLEAPNLDVTLERLNAPERLKMLNGCCLLRDQDGNMWAGTLGQGLWRISSAHGKAPTAERFSGEPGLTSEVVQSLFEDRDGNLWISTPRGLNRLSEASLITMLNDEEVNRAGPTVTVAAEDGSVWVGTENGLYRFAGDLRTRYDEADGLPAAPVNALESDANGVLWVAAGTRGLMRLQGGKFSLVGLSPDVYMPFLWVIAADFEGGIWLGDRIRGLFRSEKGLLRSFENVPELRDRSISCALVDRAGRLWIGLIGGTLVVYESGTFRLYAKEDGLAVGDVASVFEDSAGAIWVGGENGLSRFTSGGRFVTATALNGLPGGIGAIIEDVKGFLWFGADVGIIRLHPSELDRVATDASYRIRYDVYDDSDGLRGRSLARWGYPHAARAGDGSLWFVTTDGVAVVDPLRLKKDPLPPPVRVERVLTNGRYVDPTPGLQLPPRTGNLEIDYTALSFTAPAKVRFQYKLDGLDENWVDAGNRRKAFYTNLPPGSYRFSVRANNSGVWDQNGAEWMFSIRPRFFQTNWFYAGSLTLLGLVVLGAWQWRVHQVRREFSLVFAERARVAREIHDTLLQSVVGIGLQFHDLARQIDASPQSAKTHLDQLRRHLEMYAREARQAIVDLRSPTLRTRDLATALREVGESITAGTSVRLEVTISGSRREAPPRVEEALLRIGQEAVTNAVRHARATEVRLDLRYDLDSLTLKVSDNGLGLESSPSAEEHWGLAMMQERAKEIGGRFRLLGTPGSGTEIEIAVSV